MTANDQNPNVFDGTTPVLTVQPAQFILGRSIDEAVNSCDGGNIKPAYNPSVPMRLNWDANDTTSGVASFDVSSRNTSNYVPGPSKSTHAGATSLDINTTNYDSSCGGSFGNTFRVVTARDHRGYTATSPEVSDHVDVWDEAGVDGILTVDNLTVTRTGTWSTSTCTCHNHGRTTFSTATGASRTYSVYVETPGRTVAVWPPPAAIVAS